KRAYCLKTQPATGETYPKSDLFNKARTGDNKDISSACAHWQHKSREGAEDEDETAACDAG
ncbi:MULTISPECIES: hypothetical protein, partial [Klebsiella pneumoniae complex]|uniref:hypothetical protein n=1 Tax=Klebsiella pneumoniae complex TaxID=3390273 RepID=UPI001C8CCB8D